MLGDKEQQTATLSTQPCHRLTLFCKPFHLHRRRRSAQTQMEANTAAQKVRLDAEINCQYYHLQSMHTNCMLGMLLFWFFSMPYAWMLSCSSIYL